MTTVELPHDDFPAPASNLAHLRYVREVFLPRARADRVLAPLALAALSDYARGLELGEVRREPVAAGATARPAAMSSSAPAPGRSAPRTPTTGLPPSQRASDVTSPSSRPDLSVHFEPEPHGPGPVARWWDRTRDTIGSDLATHGLAYLGVLLLFVGVFGLVAFAFGDVVETARPLAELGIALAPFAAAVMLLRRGATIAGRALETAGGLLLPIMVLTSFLDGVPVPPDLTGPALVVALTAVTAVVSAAYAWWSMRHHDSTLRYLVAPVAWLAVALATMGVGRDIPTGKGVASVTAVQVAAIAAAMLVSLVWARSRPTALLSAPTFTSAIYGLVIMGPLAVLTWAVGDSPEIPIAVTGVIGLLLLELMIGRVRREVVTMIQPLWWLLVGLALVPSLGTAPAAVCAAAGFLVLLELEDSDGSAPLPMGLSATGLALSLLACWSEPWWAFGAMVVLAVWAHARRLRPFGVEPARQLLDLAAGLLPMAAVVAYGLATSNAPAAVLAGTVLALLATWPATRRGDQPLLRREPTDDFWVLWWDAAMVVSLVALALLAGSILTTAESGRWMLAASAGVLAVSSACGPLPARLRAWPVLGLATWCWFLVGSLLTLSPTVLGIALGIVSLAVVTAMHVAPALLGRWYDAGSTALAGLALGAGAIITTSVALGWGLVTTVALATAGWILTTVYTALDRSPATSVLAALTGPQARFAAPVLSAVGIPTTALLLLDATGLVAVESPWAPTVLAATAVLYAAATRLPVGELVAAVLGWCACLAALVAPALSTQERPALVALLALVATVLVLPARRRPLAMVWFAWASLAPIIGLVLASFTTAYGGRTVEESLAITLVAVGSALLLAAAALDLRGRSWTPAWRPTHDALLPTAVLGAAEVVVGLGVSTAAVAFATAGWVTASVAVVLVATAALTRAWSLVGAAAALGWLSVLQLRGDDVLHSPWFSILVTVALLGTAELAWRVVPDRRVWVRADWLLAVVAHVTALTALLSAGSGDSFARTFAAVGVIAIGVGLRWHRNVPVASAYGVIGTGLVLVGAAIAGPAWLALALAATSLACSVLAARTTDLLRWSLLVLGALSAFGAWLCVASWAEWTRAQTIDRTVLLGAAISLVCACLLRWTRIDRTVIHVRGGLAVLAATFTPFASLFTGAETPRFAPTTAACIALLAVALSAVIAARPLALPWVRYAAVGYLLAAGAEWSVHADLTRAQQLAALGLTTVVCAVALITPWARGLWTTWRPPVVTLGAVTASLGVVVALLALPDTNLLAVSLLVAAVLTTAIAVDTASLLAQVCTPVLVCSAWLVYAARALDGNPQWLMVPIGLTLLVIVGLLRHRLRTTGNDPASTDVVLLELTGIGFLVGTSFVQSFTVSIGYAALAALLGLLVAGWGMLTRVRRRVTAGVGVALAALLVLVGVPLAQWLPAWTGVTLWVTIACLGLLAIVGATLLEKGRAVVRTGLDGFRAMTEGWE